MQEEKIVEVRNKKARAWCRRKKYGTNFIKNIR